MKVKLLKQIRERFTIVEYEPYGITLIDHKTRKVFRGRERWFNAIEKAVILLHGHKVLERHSARVQKRRANRRYIQACLKTRIA